MSMIDKIRNKARNLAADAAKREKELDALRGELAALEEDRTKAIDADDFSKVEELTRARADLMVKIEAREIINKRKSEQGVPRAETAEAWADDCAGYQKQIDKGMMEIRKLMRQAAEKAVEVSEQINAAWTARIDALGIVDDQEPETINAGNNDFDIVSFSAADLNKIRHFFTVEEWEKMHPGAVPIMANAVMDHNNPHFHFR